MAAPAAVVDQEQVLAPVVDELVVEVEALFAQMVEAAIASLLPEVVVGSVGDAEMAARKAWQEGIVRLTPQLSAAFDAGSMANWLGNHASLSKVNPAKWGAVVAADATDYMRQASNRLVGVGDRAWTQLRYHITEEMRAGSTGEQIKQMLEAQSRGIEEGPFSEFRADTIARTEVNSAYNQGHLTGARAFGEDGPTHKQWLATGGRRTRPSHSAADGKIVKLNERFSVGGASMDGPGDPAGGASEVVNCRCTLVLLYPGDPELEGLSDTEVVGELSAAQESGPTAFSDPYEYKVKQSTDLSNYDDWRASTDPAIRSSALWQHTYEGQNVTRSMVANLRGGRNPFDGLDIEDLVPDRMLKRIGYTGYGEPPLFDMHELGQEFRRAAQWLQDQLKFGKTTSLVDQHRGMVVKDLKAFMRSLGDAGDSLDLPLSSFTPKIDEALRYSFPRATLASDGELLEGRVLVTLRPGAKVVDLAGKGTGPMRNSSETLFEGPTKIVSKKKGSDGILRIILEPA